MGLDGTASESNKKSEIIQSVYKKFLFGNIKNQSMHTSNNPRFLTNGSEHMLKTMRITTSNHPVKLAQPGMRPKYSGIVVNSHSTKHI